MLKRILESKDAIISTLAVINAPVYTPSQEEWETVKEVCPVLEPFEEVTVVRKRGKRMKLEQGRVHRNHKLLLCGGAVLEVTSNLEEPLIQRAEEDPLNWWEAKASVYPRLVKMAYSAAAASVVLNVRAQLKSACGEKQRAEKTIEGDEYCNPTLAPPIGPI
ncbi:hypothetical protein CRUP_018172 [Coryphaenoides rupestris]|nr:hypothetical protein CRUP_018172 [Coryphaenoides rupestris]